MLKMFSSFTSLKNLNNSCIKFTFGPRNSRPSIIKSMSWVEVRQLHLLANDGDKFELSVFGLAEDLHGEPLIHIRFPSKANSSFSRINSFILSFQIDKNMTPDTWSWKRRIHCMSYKICLTGSRVCCLHRFLDKFCSFLTAVERRMKAILLFLVHWNGLQIVQGRSLHPSLTKLPLLANWSLYTSQVVQQARAYTGFRSLKRL